VHFPNSLKSPQDQKNPITSHKKPLLITLSAIPSPTSKNPCAFFTPESSPSYQTPKSAMQSPKSFNSQSPTSFPKGDLIKYQKFLIEKKALQMIEENSSNSSYEEIPYMHFAHKTNKKKPKKPPWKPNSPLSNFVYQPQKDSAILKGIEYYEKIAGKKKNHLTKGHGYQVEEFYKNYVKKDKEKKQKYHKKHKENLGAELNPSLQSPSPTSMLQTGLPVPFAVAVIVNIGLGVLITEKLIKKSSKLLCKKAIKQFLTCKKAKKNAKPLRNSPSTWKIRIVSIGAEKLKKLLRLKIGQIILKKLKP
jgi:xanthosine utilization system XapX-like protein